MKQEYGRLGSHIWTGPSSQEFPELLEQAINRSVQDMLDAAGRIGFNPAKAQIKVYRNPFSGALAIGWYAKVKVSRKWRRS